MIMQCTLSVQSTEYTVSIQESVIIVHNISAEVDALKLYSRGTQGGAQIVYTLSAITTALLVQPTGFNGCARCGCTYSEHYT